MNRKNKLILLFLLLLTCCDLWYDSSDYTDMQDFEEEIFLNFETARDTILANGSDTTLITVTIPDNASEISSLTFNTNFGSFENGELSKSADVVNRFINNELSRVSQVIVKSSTLPQSSIITVRYKQWTDTLSLSSKKVYPNSITLNSEEIQLRPFYDDKIVITGYLRNSGYVSKGHSSQISVLDTLGNSRMSLNGVNLISNPAPTTDSNSQFKITYTAGETPYRGILNIIAKTNTEGSDLLVDTLKVIVTPNTNSQN